MYRDVLYVEVAYTKRGVGNGEGFLKGALRIPELSGLIILCRIALSEDVQIYHQLSCRRWSE